LLKSPSIPPLQKGEKSLALYQRRETKKIIRLSAFPALVLQAELPEPLVLPSAGSYPVPEHQSLERLLPEHPLDSFRLS
jgi:hypothetical protein